MNIIIRLLAAIGAGVILGTIVFGIFILIDAIKEFKERKDYEYKRLHRFDGPPLAKCYCKDCVYGFRPYEEFGDGIKCSKKNINHCSDAWFCADGEPRTYDSDRIPDPKMRHVNDGLFSSLF